MKKLISLLVILSMIASILCLNVSAAKVYVNCNFDSAEELTQHFIAGAFFVDDGLLYGYSEARALQSNYERSQETYNWYEYDMSITLAVADDELNDEDRFVSLVYCNNNLRDYGRVEGTTYMGFYYDVDERRFEFGNGLEYTTDNLEMLMDPIDREIDTDSGKEFITLGMSIQKGRIRCFFGNELIYDFNDTANEWLIAECTPSPFVFWQNGNFNQITNITISEPGYLYPEAAAPAVTDDNGGNENPVTTPKATSETTTRKEIVDVTDDKGNAVTDDKGNKVTEEIIVTEPPVADTNANTGNGGSSVSTGDTAYIVVAAMVATLGCALIVRKVSCK